MVRMKKSTLLITSAAFVIFFAGSSTMYGAAITDWWNLDPAIRGGRTWKGVLSINFQIVDVSSEPDRLIPGSTPSPLYPNDPRVKATFTARLESTIRGVTEAVSFSGIATQVGSDGHTYNHFYLIADAQLITTAFHEFLDNEIFSDSSSRLHDGAFTWAADPSMPSSNNVVPLVRDGFVPGMPLFAIVGIEIQTPN